MTTTTAAPITTMLLRDTRHGGAQDQAQQVATNVARFAAMATTSLDIAMYDFRLERATASVVIPAIADAAARGVAVRIGYDAGKPEAATAQTWAELQADPAPVGTGAFLGSAFSGSKVQLKPIEAGGQLMHSKYLVADNQVVWTGSTNFTDDAWMLQENNIVTVASPVVAAAFTADFDAMWAAGAIAGTGKSGGGSVTLPHGAGLVSWDFSPGDGTKIDASLVKLIQGARTRLVVCSMVLTSPTVLAALAAAVQAGVPVTGAYDKSEMAPIVAQWKKAPYDATKLADFEAVTAHLVGKNSTPYAPTGPHDFLHDKVLVADDTVATGSFNFSANAEKNAENQLHLTSPELADTYAAYVADVVRAYR